MAKDPAFLFYPGDYLRDTQMLSEKTQVAYDRIMCEHMRNICISQQQLKFLTKKLSDEEKEELMMILEKVEGGFQISWVAESIIKRREYSESRRKNRSKSNNKRHKKTSLSYDNHMENENENENVIINKSKDETEKKKKFSFRKSLLEYGFDESLVNDWLIVRKNKKASNTETAFKAFINEVQKRSDFILDDLLKHIVENSWAGFKWEWIDNQVKNKNNGKRTKEDKYREVFEAINRS